MFVTRKVLIKNLISSFRTNTLGTFRFISSGCAKFNIVKSDYEDVAIQNVTLPEVLFSAIDPYHKYTAVECGLTGKKYTYEELRRRCFSLSKALRKMSRLQKDDVVAIYMANCPDFPVSVIGIMSAGMVVTTLNPLYTPEEISKQFLDSGVKAVITHPVLYQNVQRAMSLTMQKVPVLVVKQKESDSLPEGAINFEEVIQGRIDDLPELVPGQGSDRALIPYSSGTTGLPKGVELSHFNLVANLQQCSHPAFHMFDYPTGDCQDIVPAVLPMFHLYGFRLGIDTLFYGGKVVTLPRFSPETFISVLKQHKTTHLFVAPPLVLFMTSYAGVKSEYMKHSKMVFSAAAPLAYSDEQQFKEKFPNVNIFQGYGQTETSPFISYTPRGVKTTEKIEGSIGKLLPNTTIKIIAPNDEEGKPLGPNERGELLIKGPQILRRYHNKPEETKNAFLHGWFRSGDMAYYNEEKFLFITDRLKELIKVKGFQVPPAELEALIRTHPLVTDVAVIGIPHPTQGEVPRAYVVPRKNQTLTPEELQAFVANKVAKYKHLVGGVQILDSIPKSLSGKILRKELKAQYEKQGI